MRYIVKKILEPDYGCEDRPDDYVMMDKVLLLDESGQEIEVDASSDSYAEMYYVDSWDKELLATDYNGNAFPEEADTSKTGCVYYIKEYGNTDTEQTPLDESVYNAFVEEKFGGANAIEIDYLSITEENIAAITD